MDVASLMHMAEQLHPHIHAHRASTSEAIARTDVADRARWPAPALGVQVAREGSAGSPANYIVLGTVGLALPVWQTHQADRAHARVDADVARGAEARVLRAIHVRIAGAHAQLNSALDRLRLFTAHVSPSLEQSLSLLRRGFDAGELPLATVALARERFLQSQLDVFTAYADYHRAHAELEAAVGSEVPITPDVATAAGAQ
jgi:cobalt-zinc-cadmium efflux system outer membrane protein